MLVPVSHLPAILAASCTRVLGSLRRPQPLPTQSIPLGSADSSHRPPPTALPTPRRRNTEQQPTPTRMDPDHVSAAAGAQHDDLGDATTSADGGGGSGDSWPRALLRRGWDLSRKAAIAGVAATAAPVVAPPLLILSVAGVALSFPFAAYLASIVATERLMGALLPPPPPPPPRTQPYYHACDLDGDEFLDASEAPGGEYWSETDDDAIVEENKSYSSLPLSRDPHLSEEPVPAWNDEGDTMPEGEFHFQELGQEPFVLDDREQKEEDDDYITMEALPRPGLDDSRSAAPELYEEDNMVHGIVEAPVAAEEPVQELSVSDNGDKTEDGKGTGTEEIESSKEIVSPGINIDTAEVSDVPVLDDNMLQSKIEGDVTAEMVPEEVSSGANPAAEEVVDVQMVAIATELPEFGPLNTSDRVPQESQTMAEAAYVDDILKNSSTADIVLDIGDTNTESVEHNGEGHVSSVISVVTVDDVADQACSTSTRDVLDISDDMMNVESRTGVDHSNQTTGVGDIWEKDLVEDKGFEEKDLVEDKSAKTKESKSMDIKMPTRSMSPQGIDVSKSQVLDDQSKREDEVTVEMVLEEGMSTTDQSKREDEVTVEMVLVGEVTSTTDFVTGEVVGVQVDIIASGSESLPLSDLVAQELQEVSETALVDDVQGSTVMGDIVKDIDDKNTEGMEQHSEGGACSFASGASVVTMDDAEGVMSNRSTPYVSAISEDMKSAEGRPDVEHPHEMAGFEYKMADEGKRKVVAEDRDNYTEEQLREQLDTLRTITGYRPATSLILEAELAGLYIFVGVEPPVSSRDASDLTEINMKLRFLKSIIGVE